MSQHPRPPDAPALGVADLLPLLGDWTVGASSLYRALAATLRELVERGDLGPGALLPPERLLAESLNVSRGTVMNALEVLRQAGLLESRQGSGTRIRRDARRPLLPDMDLVDVAAASRSLTGRLFDAHPRVVDLAVATLHDVDALRNIPLPTSWDAISAAGDGHGYSPQGLLRLREAICGYYQDRGLRTDPAQVLVTTGAQQALDLCASLALRRGDTVVVESPTYPGALDVFARHGARIVSVPADSHWQTPGTLRDTVQEHAPRLVYLMPGLHNPIGRVLPDSCRRDVARLADEQPLYVVEDNTLGDVVFDPRDQPLVAAYAKRDRVLSLGSLSKSAWGGLRIGWVRAEPGLTARMARLKAARDLSLSPLIQVVAEGVLADFDTVVAGRRRQLAGQAQVLAQQLRQELPTWHFAEPSGGLSLWVRMPSGDAGEFSQLALRHGVAVIAGSAHCLDGSGHQHLRLSFGQRDDVLIEGVRRLRAAWEAYAALLGGQADCCAVLPLHRPPRAG